jgi:hypothetical protein
MNKLTKEEIDEELSKALKGRKGPSLARFALAALGSVPIAGGAIAGIGGAWSEKEQSNINNVFQAWLKIQEEDLESIGKTLTEVMIRLDMQDEGTLERIQSKEYLSLIKKCFRDWSASDSENKRILLRNLLTNAATSSITYDDVIKLFIEWISKYSEIHFKVVSIIYKNDGYTRYQIWDELYGGKVREDSSEADLYKLIIYELSTGHVIRQFRETDVNGNYVKQQVRKTNNNSPFLKSAFDNKEPYTLTELGRQFVHYTMNELVPKISMNDIE